MIDADAFVLCEHEYELGQCPDCAEAARSAPPPAVHRWLEAYLLDERRFDEDFPPALAGVPFS